MKVLMAFQIPKILAMPWQGAHTAEEIFASQSPRKVTPAASLVCFHLKICRAHKCVRGPRASLPQVIVGSAKRATAEM